MCNDVLSGCTFPPLPAPYDDALRAAVAFVLERFDVLGIVASGTIIRGNPHLTSDLDIYVIQARPQRQRLQRWFHGVPAEIFVNPAHTIEGYFEPQRRAGRPLTAHMLATGVVILDRDPAVEQLQQRARNELDRSPDPAPQELTSRRYGAALQYEDACDVAEDDPLTAGMILGMAVHSMVQYRFRAANRYVPRDKDLLAALGDLDPALAELARAFYAAAGIAERLVLAGEIADRTIQARGFFEWESELENMPDA